MRYTFSFHSSITIVLYLLQALITLNLQWNRIGDIGAQTIAQALERNRVRYSFSFFICMNNLLYLFQTLTTLYLDGNDIGVSGSVIIGQTLETNQVRYTFSCFTSISGPLYTYYRYSLHSTSAIIKSKMQVHKQLLRH